MITNEATLDRGIRIAFGLALLAFGVFGPIGGIVQVATFVVAAIALGTGAVGFCPLYRLFGVSTCSVPTPRKA